MTLRFVHLATASFITTLLALVILLFRAFMHSDLFINPENLALVIGFSIFEILKAELLSTTCHRMCFLVVRINYMVSELFVNFMIYANPLLFYSPEYFINEICLIINIVKTILYLIYALRFINF